jgi:trans-aconitate methyltransferase
VAIIARQLGRPRGPFGRLTGHIMARTNGGFSRWVIGQIAGHYRGSTGRLAELGPGPGIGLQAALRQFPQARVWGIDPSPEMLSQSQRRNLAEVRAGRLTLIAGGTASLAAIAPVDVVVANHVLYFWHQPADELAAIHAALRPGGLLALGYQLRQNMPELARRHFPRQGDLLYDSDEQVARLLAAAGFVAVTHHVKGPPAAPHGRVALATS